MKIMATVIVMAIAMIAVVVKPVTFVMSFCAAKCADGDNRIRLYGVKQFRVKMAIDGAWRLNSFCGVMAAILSSLK